MQLFIHRYKLLRHKKANSQSVDLTQSGALIKVIDKDKNFGVADLCPWPQLGDLSLEDELSSQGPLFQRAIFLAEKDLMARKNKVKLNQQIPIKNHFLILDYMTENTQPYNGFCVKIKCNKNVQALANFLNNESKKFTRVRLDFNSSLTFDLYQNFLALLNTDAKNKIECIEDPYAFNLLDWNKSEVKIASDFVVAVGWQENIIKPARSIIDKKFLYLTSSMDHPIGIAHGLIQAQEYPNMTHGFLTLDQYQDTEFHKYFTQTQDVLSYQSDGFGIGFESEILKLAWSPLLDFKFDAKNQIFFDPNLDPRNTEMISEIKEYFDQNVSSAGYFLIASSGSSQGLNESLKIYAVKVENFLNSAIRVNQKFNLNMKMNWGCVLPAYHVGGLSILARSHMARSQVFFLAWKNFSVDWIIKNDIQLLSLVPTQVFDIVQKKLNCPEMLKYVFIGGANLSKELEAQFRDLGWPVVVTFGMTETSSMIASRAADSEFFKPFNGVEVRRSTESNLEIRCDSFADYCLQKIEGTIAESNVASDKWYRSDDLVEFDKNELNFKFIGRTADIVKILGESVSLVLLREKLSIILVSLGYSPLSAALMTLENFRSGAELVLIFPVNSNSNQAEILKQFNQQVLPFERVSKIVELKSKIPMTALNKIKYLELKNLIS